LRNKLVFLFAIIFGLITAFLVFDYLKDVKQVIDNTEYVEIVVANQNIPEKTTISSEMVSLKKIPVKYKHSKAILNLKEAVGKILLIPITTGESILKNQVISPGDSREGLAYMVPKGKRALTLAVDEVSGVSGFVKQGDRVDVIGTVLIGDDKPKPYTVVVLQDIEVLAVGKILDVKTDGKTKPIDVKTVTVAVTLEEARPLMMASQRGAIRLMLRSPIDDSKKDIAPFELEDFLDGR